MLLLLVVFGGFACLFPLAMYCLILASVNNRPRPTLVAGTTDFLGLLAALSGFLIVGGPIALAGLREAWRRAVPRGDLHGMADALAAGDGGWRWVWLGYGLLVVGTVAVGLLRRRRATLVYHVEPSAGRALLVEVCERCGLACDGDGPALAIRSPKPPGRAEVDLVAAPASKHLTLLWRSADRGIRERVESELAEALDEVAAPDNPASGWLLGVATVLFATLIFGMTVMILALVNVRR